MATTLSEKKTYFDDGAEPRTSDGIGSTETIGALTFDQYTTGGMGRHLGVFSTTFLM